MCEVNNKDFILNIYDEPERWLPITDYEERYKISSYGRVLSLIAPGKMGIRKRTIPILRKQHIDRSGYWFIKLQKDGYMLTIDTHILVARHFIPNPLNLPEVNHLKDKLDNYYKHLEWTTSSDNQVHAYRTGRKQLPKFEMNGRAILNRQQVMIILESPKTQRQLSIEYGVSMATINNIKNGYAWCEITGINKKKDEPMYRSAV